MRAIVGHLARAGVLQPAPSAPDRVAGRLVGEWDARARSRAAAPPRRRARASRWRQYRSVWAWVEGDALPPRGDPAPLRRPRGARARRARAATSAIPRCGPRPRAARARASAGPRQLAQRPVAAGDVADLDEAILETVAAAQPEVGRTRAVEILRGGRSKVVAKYSYDGLPHYGAYGAPARRRGARARGRAARRGHAALDRRALPEAGGR